MLSFIFFNLSFQIIQFDHQLADSLVNELNGIFKDLCIIIDLCLNFRTAVWLPNGQLQVDPKEIARLYLRGWFFIDLISCLPIQYIGLIITCAQGTCAGSGPAANSKAVKILRLLRLGKLLRLARLQRLLRKWEDAIDITPYLGK